jgi:hypothetical protein
VIPFVDLKSQYLSIKTEVDAAIQGVLESCAFTLGPEVAAFEKEFSAYSGATIGVAVNTGTSALHLALLAAGVGRGDEVITVPFTFVATVSAIDYTGAKAVFVDIDPQTFTMDVAALEAAITDRTRAIIPVSLYGQPADMDPLLEIARRHGLVVIEDACQAHGAEYKGRRSGSVADMTCFSFYPGKNLGAYGEGGMVVTDNPEYARTIRMLRDWGAEKKYHHVLKGYNFRMEGLRAPCCASSCAVSNSGPRHAAARPRTTTACLPEPACCRPRPCLTLATSITSMRSARRIDRPGRTRCWRKASSPASTIRRPSTCCRRSPTSATVRVSSRTPRRRPRKCCPCRCFRS